MSGEWDAEVMLAFFFFFFRHPYPLRALREGTRTEVGRRRCYRAYGCVEYRVECRSVLAPRVGAARRIDGWCWIEWRMADGGWRMAG